VLEDSTELAVEAVVDTAEKGEDTAEVVDRQSREPVDTSRVELLLLPLRPVVVVVVAEFAVGPMCINWRHLDRPMVDKWQVQSTWVVADTAAAAAAYKTVSVADIPVQAMLAVVVAAAVAVVDVFVVAVVVEWRQSVPVEGPVAWSPSLQNGPFLSL